jgi:hypothetical protein
VEDEIGGGNATRPQRRHHLIQHKDLSWLPSHQPAEVLLEVLLELELLPSHQPADRISGSPHIANPNR